MMFRRESAHSTIFAILLCTASSGACTTPADTAAIDITSIEDTAVKEQTIANCWLYATAAWAESMHLGATGEKLDISEGYWTFWYWFEEVTGGELKLGDLQESRTIPETGVWGVAAELAVRYGWMREQDFKPGGENTTKAYWHKEAVAALNKSLDHGRLADPEARRNPSIAFDELVRVWRLEASLASDLKRLFLNGKHLKTGADPSGTKVRRPNELEVLSEESTTTFAELIGEMAPGTTPYDGQRRGEKAWSEVYYQFTPRGTKFQRNVQRNMQDTLHKHMPVPIAWAVAEATQGVYEGEPDDYAETHMSVVVDYGATDVPGFGTLPLGVPVTDVRALDAALEPSAVMTALRIKNSWGVPSGGFGAHAAGRTYLPERPGYNDLTMEYLNTTSPYLDESFGPNSHFLVSVVLPNSHRFSLDR